MKNSVSSVRAWVVCISASLFFFYEFIQMNMFNAISGALMHSFHINASGLSRMSAFYFIANVIFLFPAGILLDRFSTKRVILLALAVCIGSTLLFSMAKAEGIATFFRFLTGIGSAFCFLSVIRLATRWFQASHLAMVTGLAVTIAMAGGMVAQTPFGWLASVLTWRHALWVDAGLGGLIFIVIALLVRDYPPGVAEQHQQEIADLRHMGYWKSMGLAFLKLQNWLGGIYTSLMNLLLVVLGGLWGAAYLFYAHGVTKSQATNITMVLFLGTIIGSPVVGWLSDKMQRRRPLMIIGALVSFALSLVLIFVVHITAPMLALLFFLLGVSTSTQIIGYPIVAESSFAAITAMSVSVVNITTQGGVAVFQPLYGHLMDLHAKYISHSTGRTYSGNDFSWAMLIFPVAFIVACFAAIALTETYCKPRKERVTTT